MIINTGMGYTYIRRDIMIIDITSTAKDELKKIIKSKNTDKPLRIYIASYG
jgi:Fe-S cluster assembly iron-binding protein IscA